VIPPVLGPVEGVGATPVSAKKLKDVKGNQTRLDDTQVSKRFTRICCQFSADSQVFREVILRAQLRIVASIYLFLGLNALDAVGGSVSRSASGFVLDAWQHCV